MKHIIPLDSFVTSDSHFGHKNILNYQPGRKFSSLEEHNEYLINIWNKTVHKNATVYHLGDFIFYNKDFNILSRLNGNIILIKGNHDHNTEKLNIPVYEYLKGTYNGIQIVLMHYPIQDWENKSRASLHFHGHCHNRLIKIVNRFDVGVDTNDLLRPYTFKELVDQRIIKDGLRDFR
ncbi:MAG: metallophosphoesterase family protein [Bacilli bacterium]|nr:metallophosphoesterase family protein [Bacilli bacterium]